MMEKLPYFLKVMISATLTGLGQRAFMNRTVGEIMWGYDDPLIDALNSLVPGLIPFKGKFGLFIDVSKPRLGIMKTIPTRLLEREETLRLRLTNIGLFIAGECCRQAQVLHSWVKYRFVHF